MCLSRRTALDVTLQVEVRRIITIDTNIFIIAYSLRTRKDKKIIIVQKHSHNLHRHLHLDCLVRLVSNDLKVFIDKVVNILFIRIHFELWKGSRRTSQLFLESIHVIEVHMCITNGMNKFTRLEARYLSHHVRQQRIGGDIKRHAKPQIGGALIHLTRELILGRVDLYQENIKDVQVR